MLTSKKLKKLKMKLEKNLIEEFSIQELETRLEMTQTPWISVCPGSSCGGTEQG